MDEREEINATMEGVAASLSREELAERWMRSAADYENSRRRNRKAIQAARAEERHSLLRSFAQVLDSLDRAAETPDLSREDLAEAVESIRNQSRALLKEFSAEPFDPMGESFDPRMHEALDAVDLPDRPEGEIAQVFEKGYRMDSGAILRPARVAVVRHGAGRGEAG